MIESISKLLGIFQKVLDVEIDENVFRKGNLIENLNIDSLIALQLFAEIEKEFHILIEEEELAIKLIDSPSFFVDYYNKYQSNHKSGEAKKDDA